MLIECLHRNTENFATVVSMLSAADLPVEDLNDPNVSLFVCIEEQSVCGAVGLQVLNNVALLRSLIVSPEYRGRGLGNDLTAFAESEAIAKNLDAIYLLTEAAERFFSQRGYKNERRKNAPRAVQRTSQFSELCPDSAQLMCLKLDSAADN